MEGVPRKRQYMGTSRTITCPSIVKGVPFSSLPESYKNPTDSMMKNLSSSFPSLSYSKLEFHPYAYINFNILSSFPNSLHTSVSDFSINPSNESPASTPPQSPTLPIPFNPVTTTTIPSYPLLLPQIAINILASQPNLNETI